MTKIHDLKIYSVDDLQISRLNAENILTRVESVSMSKILVIRSMNVMNGNGQNEQFNKSDKPLTVGVELDENTFRRLERAGAAVPYVDPAIFADEPSEPGKPIDKMTKAELEAEAKRLEIEVPAGSDKAAILALIKAAESADASGA